MWIYITDISIFVWYLKFGLYDIASVNWLYSHSILDFSLFRSSLVSLYTKSFCTPEGFGAVNSACLFICLSVCAIIFSSVTPLWLRQKAKVLKLIYTTVCCYMTKNDIGWSKTWDKYPYGLLKTWPNCVKMQLIQKLFSKHQLLVLQPCRRKFICSKITVFYNFFVK